jgi:hypothetical protein
LIDAVGEYVGENFLFVVESRNVRYFSPAEILMGYIPLQLNHNTQVTILMLGEVF